MRVDPTSITSSISGQNILVNTLFFYEDLKISNHNQHTFMNMFINLYFFHYPLSVSCLNVRDEAFRLNNVQNLNFFYFKIEEIWPVKMGPICSSRNVGKTLRIYIPEERKYKDFF